MNKFTSIPNRINFFAFFLLFTGISFWNPLFTQVMSRIVEEGGTGPYSAVVTSESTLLTHIVFRPADLSAFGDDNKLPIISRGNAACANTSTYHINFLNEIASHGFLVIKELYKWENY